MATHTARTVPVRHYKIPSQKSLPGRQFTGKNPPRPAAARTGGFLPANCRPGENFLEGDNIMGRLFMGAGDILIRGNISTPGSASDALWLDSRGGGHALSVDEISTTTTTGDNSRTRGLAMWPRWERRRVTSPTCDVTDVTGNIFISRRRRRCDRRVVRASTQLSAVRRQL